MTVINFPLSRLSPHPAQTLYLVHRRVHTSVHPSAQVINSLFIKQMEGDGRKQHQEANQIV